MDNKYLWKRKNRYWVRVRVPDKVRDIIGSVELCLNLYTSDLQEANVLKHGAVSKLKKRIESARKIKENQGPETTKEELLKQYAQAIRDEYETGNYDTSNGPGDVLSGNTLFHLIYLNITNPLNELINIPFFPS